MVTPQVNKEEDKSSLCVISKTWNRDSHGLFDYESPIIRQMTSTITGNSSLFRQYNEVKVAKESPSSLESRLLCNFIADKGSYSVSNPIDFHMEPTEENINELQNKIWYVIKNDTINANANNTGNNNEANNQPAVGNDPYSLNIGDIIKLGRVKYAVTELKINDTIQEIEKDDKFPIFNLVTSIVQESDPNNTEISCKFCYSNETDDPNNKLVTLCKCSGSIMNVHFNCLKKWIQTKLSIKENTPKNVISYLIKSFNCEICKKPYPLRFILNGQYYSLIDYNRPTNSSYIILESLNQFKDSMNIKSIQVISLTNNVDILIGRGNTADVRVNDISVSRTHAAITLKDNTGVYLSNQNSKFGTLVLMKHQVPVPKGKSITLQIGRTLLLCSEIIVPHMNNTNGNSTSVYCNTEPNKSKNTRKPVFLVQKVDEEKQDSVKDINFNLNLNLNEECPLINYPKMPLPDLSDVEINDLNLSAEHYKICSSNSNNNNQCNQLSNNNKEDGIKRIAILNSYENKEKKNEKSNDDNNMNNNHN